MISAGYQVKILFRISLHNVRKSQLILKCYACFFLYVNGMEL